MFIICCLYKTTRTLRFSGGKITDEDKTGNVTEVCNIEDYEDTEFDALLFCKNRWMRRMILNNNSTSYSGFKKIF